VVSPELIPCKFEEFQENTLHNQVLRRAVVIIRTMLLPYAKDAGAPSGMHDERSGPLLRSCDNLLELMVRVDDVPLTWDMISSVQLSRLEERYYGIFHYAKLLIKCAAPVVYSGASQPAASDFLAGFSQVWDAAVLYELHIANYLRKKLSEGQARKRSARFRIVAQSQSRMLVKFPSVSEGDEVGCAEIRPDIIIWDDEKKRAHLIIDTKWKRYSGVTSVSTDDAYQVHAYATTYSVKPGEGPKSSRPSKLVKKPAVRTKTYYPPVCLLYPSLGESMMPEQGDFSGIGSEFLLARSPMDLDNLEFDPSVVLGKWWPLKNKIS
jgi:5-methylcytosine-specific restriction endonuclease McrBC regulatory subunit McrC